LSPAFVFLAIGGLFLLKFLKNNWVSALALLLLLIISIPLLYFGNLLKILNRQNEYFVSTNSSSKYLVGVSLNNLAEARWMKERAWMLEEAKNRGITINFKIANHSLTRQTRQIANLIAHGARVLIINPVSRSGLEEVLESARRQGIKIIQYDELTSGPADLFLGVDYRETGKIQAKCLMEKSGPGNYIILRGPQSSYRAEMLYNGQRDILRIKNNRNVNILAVDILPIWSAEEAVNKIRATIVHQKLHAVLAPDDLTAEELVKFFKEQKITLPFITGAGAEIGACQRIIKGEQVVTVYCNYQQLAKMAVFSAKQLLYRKKPPTSTTVFSEGKRIPAYIVPVYSVTKDDLKSVLIDQLKVYTIQDLSRE
jgi:ABC-type xylose transport system substrate-binding protein